MGALLWLLVGAPSSVVAPAEGLGEKAVKAFVEAFLRFAHVNVVPQVLSDRLAYVTAEYRLKATVAGKVVEAEGLETLVLLKGLEATPSAKP